MGIFDFFSKRKSTSIWTEHMNRADLGKAVQIDFADFAKTMRAVSAGMQSADPTTRTKALARGAEAAFMLKMAMDGLPKTSKQQAPKEIQALLHSFSRLTDPAMLLRGGFTLPPAEVKAFADYLKVYLAKNASPAVKGDIARVFRARDPAAAFNWFVRRHSAGLKADDLSFVRCMQYALLLGVSLSPTPSAAMHMFVLPMPLFMVSGSTVDSAVSISMYIALGLGIFMLMAFFAPAATIAAPSATAVPAMAQALGPELFFICAVGMFTAISYFGSQIFENF